MSRTLQDRVAQLEHEQRRDREQIINLSALVMDLVAMLDPKSHQEAVDDYAKQQGLEPGGTFILKRHGSETN